MTNFKLFKEYYKNMMLIGDCDPAYPILNYVCDRFELNMEQRYWIAFLYGTNYSAPTTYYIYNEFPDFENVDVERLQRWWNINRQNLFFQTDRAKVKNFDMFVRCFISYKELIGNRTQQEAFSNLNTYEEVYKFASGIFYFGRFTLFNYIEALNELTNLRTEPTFIDLKQAESSRNGLCYVFNKQHYITMHHKEPEVPIDYEELQTNLVFLYETLRKENKDIPVTYWNIETALCAFKKLFWGSRYLGYYIDRQMEEIKTMEENIPIGVHWGVLWQFRQEFYDKSWLGEFNNWQGIRKYRMELFLHYKKHYGMLEEINIPNKYKKKIIFENNMEAYNVPKISN